MKYRRILKGSGFSADFRRFMQIGKAQSYPQITQITQISKDQR